MSSDLLWENQLVLFANRAAHRHGSTQRLQITEGVITQMCGSMNLFLPPPVWSDCWLLIPGHQFRRFVKSEWAWVAHWGRYADQGCCGSTMKRKSSWSESRVFEHTGRAEEEVVEAKTGGVGGFQKRTETGQKLPGRWIVTTKTETKVLGVSSRKKAYKETWCKEEEQEWIQERGLIKRHGTGTEERRRDYREIKRKVKERSANEVRQQRRREQISGVQTVRWRWEEQQVRVRKDGKKYALSVSRSVRGR